MTLLLAIVLLAPPKPPVVVGPRVGPNIPAGADPDFQRLVIQIETSLSRGDFKGASKLAQGLPKRSATVRLDFSGVPANLRDSFSAAVQQGILAWCDMPEAPTFTVNNKAPDFALRFAPTLNTDAGSNLPAGSAFFMGPSTPRIEMVVGLNRGRPLQPSRPVDVRNEVAHGIGRYLGVASSPLYGTLASHSDLPSPRATGAYVPELLVARANLKIADTLRSAIAKRQVLLPARPSAFLDPTSGDAGEVEESLRANYLFQLTNRGNSPLLYRIMGDCGCVVGGGSGELKPGATALLKPYINTTDFAGDLNKRLILFTNDPEMPTKVLPIHVKVLPSYRFLAPQGSTTVLGEGKDENTIYLSIPKGSPLVPLSAQVDGVPAQVTMEPWAGKLPDPDLGEGVKARQGYRLRVTFEEPYPVGRAEATLSITTSSEQKPRLRFPLYVQAGIVAMPEEVYLGTLGSDPKRSSFIVSRPGRAFTVREVTTTLPSLSATAEPLANGDTKVVVLYNGKAPAGDYSGEITVYTDDLRQPSIKVRVRGIVP